MVIPKTQSSQDDPPNYTPKCIALELFMQLQSFDGTCDRKLSTQDSPSDEHQLSGSGKQCIKYSIQHNHPTLVPQMDKADLGEYYLD